LKILILITLLLTKVTINAQSISRISEWPRFDTLRTCNLWIYENELYPDSTIKHQIKYLAKGRSCVFPVNSGIGGKCVLLVEERHWRTDGSLEWEFRINSNKREKVLYKWITKSGKVAIRTRKTFSLISQ